VKILHRYVLREHAGPLVFALTALTSLLLLNYIARNIGQLVGKGLPWSVVGEFVALSVPFTVAMTLPMAVLVAVLYAFSRLASENEITAIKASGIALRSLLIPVVCGAVVLCAIMIWFNDQVLPRANHRLRTLQSDIARKKPTFALRPRVINEVLPGKFYLFAGRLDQASNLMREVTIYDLGDPARRRTTYADSGEMALGSNGDLLLTLYYGFVLELRQSAPAEFQRVYFIVDKVRVPGVGNELSRSTNDTYKGEREMSICEMQHVFALNQDARADARSDITRTLVNGVRAAAAGISTVAAAPPPSDPHVYGTGWELGHLYCDGLRPIVGVDSLEGKRAARPVAGPPVRVVPQVVLSQLTSSIDVDRARMDENARTASIYDVEIQKKFALAAACVVFTLLGAPIALRFPRGGVGLVIGVSFAVFGLYYVGLIAGEPLAENGKVSPVAAMWASDFVVLMVGAGLLTRLGAEAATNRSGEWHERWTAFRARVAARAARRRRAA
jgi:lipopolysaccharide export system permease protein